MAEKTNFPPAKNRQELREEILKSVTQRAHLINPKLEQVSRKWDADISKIIDDTMNFYSGLNIKLSADQLAEQIINTKLKGLNQEKKERGSNQPQEKKEIPRYITPKSNQKKDPYREETEKEENINNDNVSTQKESLNENQNNNLGAINQPPKLNSSNPEKDSGPIDREESQQYKENINQQPQSNNKVQEKNGDSPNSSETPNTKSSNLPPKLKGEEGKSTEKSKNETGNTDGAPSANTKNNNLGQNLKNIQRVLSQNKTPKKLAVTTWIFLGTGAVIIDFVQGWIGVTIVASIINLLADFFIGLCLFSFFAYKKMLDRRLAISLVLGFLIDFVSLGIMPAWSFDIAYAWFITDGSKVISKIPGAGEKANEAIQKIASKKV